MIDRVPYARLRGKIDDDGRRIPPERLVYRRRVRKIGMDERKVRRIV